MLLYGVISVKIKSFWYLGEACMDHLALRDRHFCLTISSTGGAGGYHIGSRGCEIARCNRMGVRGQGPARSNHPGAWLTSFLPPAGQLVDRIANSS